MLRDPLADGLRSCLNRGELRRCEVLVAGNLHFDVLLHLRTDVVHVQVLHSRDEVWVGEDLHTRMYQ